MKHATLAVSTDTFEKWITARNRVEPIFIRMTAGLYRVRCDFEPGDDFINSKLGFLGVHEDKVVFQEDFCDELDEIETPSFPEDEHLGFLSIVKVDNNNIDIFYFLLNDEIENQIDLLLSMAPQSWELQLFSDKAGNAVEIPERVSREDLILTFWNKNFPVKQIVLELHKSDIYLGEKSVRNILTELRKKLGVEKVPLRRKVN